MFTCNIVFLTKTVLKQTTVKHEVFRYFTYDFHFSYENTETPKGSPNVIVVMSNLNSKTIRLKVSRSLSYYQTGFVSLTLSPMHKHIVASSAINSWEYCGKRRNCSWAVYSFAQGSRCRSPLSPNGDYFVNLETENGDYFILQLDKKIVL